ncbi:MAG: helix-turn-helix domain-containing protein [Opitutales bacterium]
MDKPVKKRGPAEPAGPAAPVVVFANWFQFGPGERIRQGSVESRLLLWCCEGRGHIRVSGAARALEAGDWVFLPWRREQVYEADARHPFRVGAIHVVPCHAPDHPVVFQVAHEPGDPLAGRPWRQDTVWPALAGAVHGRIGGEYDRLGLLAAYIIEKFQRAAPEEAAMRALAQLLLGELQLAVQTRGAGAQPMPGKLRRMQEFARAHPGRNLTIAELAQVAGCSEASVHRLFRTYAAVSPGRWMARLRAQQAARLLRTTTLAVREVGEQVGLPDPFHFSRFFKQQTGLSPRAYQRSRRAL